AVTKHISDSFNLPGGLSGPPSQSRSAVQAVPFAGDANDRIFRENVKGFFAEKSHFFLIFVKNG
ncbi:hypothetical protein, partial [uncultured Fibrobacter sp.]|uniref:hypothetical protein n=1 Tax=uncultured Fibrobacter sp. TaxID=261512 RepID=UPI00260431B5